MSQPYLPTIAVVDGNGERYPFLTELERRGRLQVTFLENGRMALRVSSALEPAFWLVNDQLIDMRGIDCIEMLVALHPEARFFLIADTYEANDERLCFRFKRVKYLCRPLDSQWLSRLLKSATQGKHGLSGIPQVHDRGRLRTASTDSADDREGARASPQQDARSRLKKH